MKVAIVYNESAPELYTPSSGKKVTDLEFEPYFGLDGVDPILEYEYMAESLRKIGYSAYTLNIKDNVDVFLEDLKNNKPDVIFNLVELYKDIPRLEATFTDLLELLEIPYTGATPSALSTSQNKTLTKRIISASGIRTPKFKFIRSLEKNFRIGLNYPLIVKPAFEDASVGIDNNSIVGNSRKLRERIEYVFRMFEQPALVEEFIVGRELNVAVFGDKRKRVLPISEIDFSSMPKHLHPIVSFQAKWDPHHEAYHKTLPICPAPLTNTQRLEAEKMAIGAVNLVGTRDYTRVDMRLSKKDKKLYVLEVNPNPDLQEDAGFMRSAKYAGFSYRKTLKRIVDFAYARRKKK
ncbi:MAG: ATP-grasp domain-containing protein [Melioribacteraceae bacterium]|nr:ATP-grasp domain-containing protein [Melioribacteraceae bacterium]